MNCSFCGKSTEIVRNRVKIEVFKKDENEEIIKQQSEKTVDEIHKSCTNHDSYTFK